MKIRKPQVFQWVLASTLFMVLCPLMAAAPGDLQFERKDETALESFPPSIFQHWKHRIHYRCDACHNNLFEMELGATPISMDEMDDGKTCGACHNNELAFGVGFGNCVRCHRSYEE